MRSYPKKTVQPFQFIAITSWSDSTYESDAQRPILILGWRTIPLSSGPKPAYNPPPLQERHWVGLGMEVIPMKRPWLLAIGLAFVLFPAGCKSVDKPDLSHPGTAPAQQARALRYDPYPDNESGPAMVGVRPREYDVPPPEPSRARWYLNGWGQ
jgi:hypothetical protein